MTKQELEHARDQGQAKLDQLRATVPAPRRNNLEQSLVEGLAKIQTELAKLP